MTIDAEALCDVGSWEGCLHILYAVGQTRALVGSEWDDRLTLQVVSVLLEEGEHHLRIGAPPHRTTNEHGVVSA